MLSCQFVNFTYATDEVQKDSKTDTTQQAKSKATDNTTALPTKSYIENLSISENGDYFSGGDGTNESPYLISTAEDLAVLAGMINYQVGLSGYSTGYKNVYFKQTADIDLSCYENWIPIGLSTIGASTGSSAWWQQSTATGGFQGFYDGGNQSIVGMNIDVDNLWESVTTGQVNSDLAEKPDASSKRGYFAVGLFGRVATGGGSGDKAIYNLTLKDSTITLGEKFKNIYASNVFVGGIVGYCSTQLSNLTVDKLTLDGLETTGINKNSIVDSNGVGANTTDTYGGIVGNLEYYNGKIYNCTVKNSSIKINNWCNSSNAGKAWVGGLAGRVHRAWSGKSGDCYVSDNQVINTSVVAYDKGIEGTTTNNGTTFVDKLVGAYMPDNSATTVYYAKDKTFSVNNYEQFKNVVIGTNAIEYVNNVEADSKDKDYSYNKLDAIVVDISYKDDAEIIGKYNFQIDNTNFREQSIDLSDNIQWYVGGEAVVGETSDTFTVNPSKNDRVITATVDGVHLSEISVKKIEPTLNLDLTGNDENNYPIYTASFDEKTITYVMGGSEETAITNVKYSWELTTDNKAVENTDSSYSIGKESLDDDEELICTVTFMYYGEKYTIVGDSTVRKTVYLDFEKGNDYEKNSSDYGDYNYSSSNVELGTKKNPAKTFEQAFAILYKNNPNASAKENVIVVINRYKTQTATTQVYGRNSFDGVAGNKTEGRYALYFPELLQGHEVPHTEEEKIDENTDSQEFLRSMYEGMHVNATIKGENENSAIDILCDGKSNETQDRGILQFSNLIFENINITFHSNNSQTGEAISRRICWYCNGYNLTLRDGVEFEGISYASSEAKNGMTSDLVEAEIEVPKFHIISTTLNSLPIVGALTEYNGEILLDQSKLTNTVHVYSGSFARILGGGRTGDTLLSTMKVLDGDTVVKPYRRGWLYAYRDKGEEADKNDARQGNSRYLYQSNIIVEGDAVVGVVAGGQTDSIYMGNSKVTIGGDAIVGTALAGSIGYGVYYIQNTYPDEADTGVVGSDRNSKYASDFKGNCYMTLKGNAKVWNYYGGSLGRNTNNTYLNCAIRGEKITLNMESGTVVKNFFGGGAGGTTGTFSRETDVSGEIGDIIAKTNVEINISGGHIMGNLYGGGDGYYEWATTKLNRHAGWLCGDVVINISGGVIDGNVYGGGQGVEGTEHAAAGSNADTIYADATNFAQIIGSCFVSITGGEFNGNIYGGGEGTKRVLDDADKFKDMAKITGQTAVVVNSENVNISGSIYGGGAYGNVVGIEDNDDYIGSSNVFIANGKIKGAVYGGGQNASVITTSAERFRGTMVMAIGGTVSGRMYGGCENGDVIGSSKVFILGGNFKNVIYGGNNKSGQISQNSYVYVASREGTEGPYLENSLFGAGCGYQTIAGVDESTGTGVRIGDRSSDKALDDPNEILENNPDSDDDSYYVINSIGKELLSISGDTYLSKFGELLRAFPEEKAKEINSKIKLTNRIYGGGQMGFATCSNVMLYGGTLTASKGVYDDKAGQDVEASIFGGGFGNPKFAEDDSVGEYPANSEKTRVYVGEDFTFEGKIYGGGEYATVGLVSTDILEGKDANVYTDPHDYHNITSISYVEISDNANITGEVFGGGKGEAGMNYAKIYGNTEVLVKDNAVLDKSEENSGNSTNVFGGSRRASIDGNTKVTVKNNALVDCVFGGNKTSGDIQGNSYVYTYDKVKINTLYGGGFDANLDNTAYVNIKANMADEKDNSNTSIIKEVFGGGYSASVNKAVVNIEGGVENYIYGGGFKGDVNDVIININSGTTVTKNIYGGCNQSGKVQNVKINIVTAGKGEEAIHINGSVFGAGYGVNTSTINTKVVVDLYLTIRTIAECQGKSTITGPKEADIVITEEADSTQYNGVVSGKVNPSYKWNNSDESGTVRNDYNGSYIKGSVYGGGDMGQIGTGEIVSGGSDATIQKAGCTDVEIKRGHIEGNVFGGGSGEADSNSARTAYMGAVFGKCNVKLSCAIIEGNVYGGGDQSYNYASDKYDNQATYLLIEEPDGADYDEEGSAVAIFGSVFGGGNTVKGSSHATVYTVFGDTQVDIIGQKTDYSTVIYLFGGVYGDGNLCLVNGYRTVNMSDFHFNSIDFTYLKTFYSIQRADKVNLTRTRIVLFGAVDLVDASGSSEIYSFNRVGQLNMYQSSTIKLCSIVRYLGGLRSDQDTDTVFIDRGNNSINDYDVRGGSEHTNVAVNEKMGTDKVETYHKEYEQFKKDGSAGEMYKSFNVVCVANGRYLEIKKDAKTYGNVTGLFSLELLYAVPGEGGGFVYGNIGTDTTAYTDDKASDSALSDPPFDGSTGDFICCTTKTSKTGDVSESDYMFVRDDTGGYNINNETVNYNNETIKGDYSYYYWFIVGNNYNWDVELQGYVGSPLTEYSTDIPLANYDKKYSYVLEGITVNGNDSNSMAGENEENVKELFSSDQFKDNWSESYNNKNFYAIELQVVINGDTDNSKSIGYLTYDKNHKNQSGVVEPTWGVRVPVTIPDGVNYTIDKDNTLSWTTQGGQTMTYYNYDKDSGYGTIFGLGTDATTGQTGTTFEEQVPITNNLLYQVPQDGSVKGLDFRFVLHKGSGVKNELYEVPLTLQVKGFDWRYSSQDGKVTDAYNTDSGIDYNYNIYTSIIMVVPYQEVNFATGRRYESFFKESNVYITHKSSFTAEVLTDYIAGAYQISDRYLSFGDSGRVYLMDDDDSADVHIAFTLDSEGNLIYASEGTKKVYNITKNSDGTYNVEYLADSVSPGRNVTLSEVKTVESGSRTTLPKGTTITMVATINEGQPTYWYYYCQNDMTGSDIPLKDFVRMNQKNSDSSDKFSLYKASNGLVGDDSGDRVIENLIFVVDFAGADDNWVDQNIDELQLRVGYQYTTTGNFSGVDMFDYCQMKHIKSDIDKEYDVYNYSHITPEYSGSVYISKTADGLEHKDNENTGIKIKVNEGSQTNGKYIPTDIITGIITIDEDKSFANTQIFNEYDKREYSVKLTVTDENNEVCVIPAGTVVQWGDSSFVLEKNNKYLIIPMVESGEHNFEINTINSIGLEGGEWILTANLYSSREGNYYNDINTSHKASAEVVVEDKVDYGIKVTGSDHIFTCDSSVNLTVDTVASKEIKNDSVKVKLFEYDSATISDYEEIQLTDLFVYGTLTDINLGDDSSAVSGSSLWKGEFIENAPAGTYRLQFTYHHRVEYWDFIIED
jgi:hypothetical protein